MLFLWTKTKLGRIWAEGDIFREMTSARLPDGFECVDVSLAGEQSVLNIQIALPEDADEARRPQLVSELGELFAALGLKAAVQWTRIKPGTVPERTRLVDSPFTWAGAAGVAAAAFQLGPTGTAWSMGAAAAGFLVSWLAVSGEGARLFRKFMSDIGHGGR